MKHWILSTKDVDKNSCHKKNVCTEFLFCRLLSMGIRVSVIAGNIFVWLFFPAEIKKFFAFEGFFALNTVLCFIGFHFCIMLPRRTTLKY